MVDYLIGSAVEDVTPSDAAIDAGAVFLAGYVARRDPAAGVAAALSTRAVVIDDGVGGALALVTLDVCAIAGSFTAEVRERVLADTGIEPDHLLLTVTHTHSAPVTRPFPVFTQDAAVPDADYLGLLADSVVTAVGRAFTERAPARLFFGRGATTIGFNRHTVAGPYDTTLDVLQAVADDTGDTIAIVFFHGCHPVTEADLSLVSPDFPGVARDEVEAVFGGDALFVQGFAGTVNPRPGLDTGTTLAADVGAALAGGLVRLRGPIRARTMPVDLTMRPPPDQHTVEQLRASLVGDLDLQSASARRWCDLVLAAGAATSVSTELFTARIGTGSTAWRLVASAHETVAEWALRVRALWAEPLVTLAGYSGAVDCYLPTTAILEQTPDDAFPVGGSYEGCSSFMYYGLATRFAATVDVEYLATVDVLDGHHRQSATWAIEESDGAVAFVRTAGGVAVATVQPDTAQPNTVQPNTVQPDTGWTLLPRGPGTAPTAVRAINGMLGLFAGDADGGVAHTWQSGPARGWAPWVRLGGATTDNVAATLTLDGRVVLFARGTNGRLTIAAQTAALAGWGDWSELPGAIAGSPAVAVAAGGQAVVVARGPGGELLALRLSADLDVSGGWTVVADGLAFDPVITLDATGVVLAAAVRSDGALLTSELAGPDGTWSAPTSAGAELVGRVGLAVATSGAVSVVGRGRDGGLHLARRSAATGRWGRWTALGGRILSDPAVVLSSADDLLILSIEESGALVTTTIPARARSARPFVTVGEPPSGAVRR